MEQNVSLIALVVAHHFSWPYDLVVWSLNMVLLLSHVQYRDKILVVLVLWVTDDEWFIDEGDNKVCRVLATKIYISDIFSLFSQTHKQHQIANFSQNYFSQTHLATRPFARTFSSPRRHRPVARTTEATTTTIMIGQRGAAQQATRVHNSWLIKIFIPQILLSSNISNLKFDSNSRV
jgi:hypothetical protein